MTDTRTPAQLRSQTEYILISSLGNLDRSKSARLPQHLTLVQWFKFAEMPRAKELLSQLQQVAHQAGQIVITGEKVDFFGDQHDIAVRKLKSNNELKKLHTDLLEVVKKFGGEVRQAKYVGDNYAPHITKQSDVWLEENESAVLSHLQLMQAVDGDVYRCQLVCEWPIGEVQ